MSTPTITISLEETSLPSTSVGKYGLICKKNLKPKNMNFQEHWSPWISVQYPGQTDKTHQTGR